MSEITVSILADFRAEHGWRVGLVVEEIMFHNPAGPTVRSFRTATHDAGPRVVVTEAGRELPALAAQIDAALALAYPVEERVFVNVQVGGITIRMDVTAPMDVALAELALGAIP